MTNRWAGTMLVAIVSLVAGSAIAGEGFGGLGGKTVVTLMRTNPPEMLLPGTRIGVKVGAPQHQALASKLVSLLQVQLPAGDKRLTISSTAPETVIQVAIVENGGNSEWQTRTYNVKHKDGRVETVTQRTLVIQHTLGVTYSATDTKTGGVVDSTVVTIPFNQGFPNGNGAPTLDQVAAQSVETAASRIVGRLTFTRVPIQVLLPEGSLEPAKAMAQAGLWNKYLEMLEAMPAKANPRDESYRQFALGVAYEALGYAADSADVALNYLERAAGQYNRAVEMKPDEKYFLKGFSGDLASNLFRSKGEMPTDAQPPLARTQEAVVKYQKVKELKLALERGEIRMMASAAGAKSLDGPGEEVMDNSAVIEMVQANLAEDVILTAVKGAPRTAFDVSSKGLIQLSKGGVKGNLLRQIQAIAGSRR